MRLLLGLGTGRCGTVSLCEFLNAQPGVQMVHEGMVDGENHLFSWDGGDSDKLDRWLAFLEQRAGKARFFGDIGMYLLPYADRLLERYPDSRVIVMRRGRASTVSSYLHKAKRYNHWMEHDGTVWERHPLWDSAFPTYDAATKPAALRRYWDEYYAAAERLREANPDRVQIFDMAQLNDRAGRAAILDHAGVPLEGRVVDQDFHLNRTPWWKRLLSVMRP